MADLDFLAAGVQEDEQWTRKTERAPKANPFLPKLETSWQNRAEVAGKMRGKPFSVQVTTYDQLKLVRNALIRGARELGIGLGLAYFGPPRETDGPDNGMRVMLETGAIKTEEDWTKNSGGNVLVKFRAQPKRRVVEDQENAGDDSAEDETPEDEDASEADPEDEDEE
jgi:hypothetical protein